MSNDDPEPYPQCGQLDCKFPKEHMTKADEIPTPRIDANEFTAFVTDSTMRTTELKVVHSTIGRSMERENTRLSADLLAMTNSSKAWQDNHAEEMELHDNTRNELTLANATITDQETLIGELENAIGESAKDLQVTTNELVQQRDTAIAESARLLEEQHHSNQTIAELIGKLGVSNLTIVNRDSTITKLEGERDESTCEVCGIIGAWKENGDGVKDLCAYCQMRDKNNELISIIQKYKDEIEGLRQLRDVEALENTKYKSLSKKIHQNRDCEYALLKQDADSLQSTLAEAAIENAKIKVERDEAVKQADVFKVNMDFETNRANQAESDRDALKEENGELRKDRDAYETAWKVTEQNLLQSEASRYGLWTALKNLVDRMEVIHADPHYQSVWQSYQNHGGDYSNGPKYEKEMNAAKSVLSALPQGDQVEAQTKGAGVIYEH